MSCNKSIVLKLSGLIIGILGVCLTFYIDPHILNALTDPNYERNLSVGKIISIVMVWVGMILIFLGFRYE